MANKKKSGSTFATNLKAAMSEAMVSQFALCEQTGIPKSAISQYLSGKNMPKAGRLEVLANALAVSPEDLLQEVADSSVFSSDRITIKAAARCLGKSEIFMRLGLQQKILPFGAAVPGTGKRYIYYINPRQFREYVGPEQFDSFFNA